MSVLSAFQRALLPYEAYITTKSCSISESSTNNYSSIALFKHRSLQLLKKNPYSFAFRVAFFKNYYYLERKKKETPCPSDRLHSSNDGSSAAYLPSQSFASSGLNRTNHNQSSPFRYHPRQMPLSSTALATPKSARADGITFTANAVTCTSDTQVPAAERRQPLAEAVSARRPRRRMLSTDITLMRSVRMQNVRFAADEAIRLGFE